MQLISRSVRFDSESWRMWTYIRLEPSEIASVKEAVDEGWGDYVEDGDQWEKREKHRDVIRDIYELSDISSRGSGIPGYPFADEPCLRCVGKRVILTQYGGLDV